MELSPRRAGRFTASEIHRLMGKKGGFESYVAEIAAVRAHGVTASKGGASRSTWAMERGNEFEDEARRTYAAKIAPIPIVQVSGMPHATHNTLWATPDSYVDITPRMTIDFKVPLPHTWWAMRIAMESNADAVPTDYYWQAQCQMAVYGASGHVLVYYNPEQGIPDATRHIVFNVLRNEEDITRMLERVSEAERMLESWGLPFVERTQEAQVPIEEEVPCEF